MHDRLSQEENVNYLTSGNISKNYDVSTDEAYKSMCMKQDRGRVTGSSLDEYCKKGF